MPHALFIVFAALALAGCGGGGGGGGSGDSGEVAGVTALGSANAGFIRVIATDSGLTGVDVKYGAECKQVTYSTPGVHGGTINASTLLCMPQRPAGAAGPLLVYEHGTIFADYEAPTTGGSTNYYMGLVAAGLGYTAVMPDYIGFGASADQFHPYLHAQSVASSSINAVRAVRNYLATQGVSTNGKLFLSGYSEGGYAAYTVQRSMELDYPGEFAITASMPGDGPYDLHGTAVGALAASTLSSPTYPAFIVTAYDSIYNSPSRLSYYFQSPYAARAAVAFDGSRNGSEVAALFTTDPLALFTTDFLNSFRGIGETDLKGRLTENSLHDSWVPQSKTRLFHGVDDEIVPYANAIAVRDHVAATAPDFAVVNCDAGSGVATTHGACALPYWREVVRFFGLQNPGL